MGTAAQSGPVSGRAGSEGRYRRTSLRSAQLRDPIRQGPVVLRRMRPTDRHAWQEVRQQNLGWLSPWEATNPDGKPPLISFGQYVRHQRRQARLDEAYSYVLDYRGQLAGQVTVAGVTRGSLQSAHIGYWISEHVAGQGLMTLAVAMTIDHCFSELRLHRVEINIRPENVPSLRVVEKLGLRDEGVRQRYLHIQGRWCDHRTFAITVDEAGGSVVDRLEARSRSAGENGPS